MRALVVNPPLLIERDFIDHPYFCNLGALQLAAALEFRGHHVEVADSFSTEGSCVIPEDNNLIRIGCDATALLSSFRESEFDAVVVCLSVFHRPFMKHDFTAGFLKILKKKFPHAYIIAADASFGGFHYIEYSADDFFKSYPQCGYLVQGESEIALAELVESIPSGIPARGALSGDPARVSLDELPFPAWHLIDAGCYFAFLQRFFTATGRGGEFADLLPALPLVTSRGCAFKCSFCSNASLSSTHRRNSPEYVREHLQLLKKNYGIRGAVVLDGLANGGDFSGLLDTLENLELKVFFTNGLRADILRPIHIKRLARLTPSIAVSAESADDRIRNGVLNKNLRIEAVEKVAAACRKNMLPLEIHYMLGVPGETPEETNSTLAHACLMSEKYGAEPLLQFCVPLPGTPLHAGQFAGPTPQQPQADYFSRFSKRAPDKVTVVSSAFLSEASSLLKARLAARSPEKLIINLTYHCDNNCRICVVGDRPIRHMSFRRAARLMAGYHQHGTRLVDFDGGEPTQHPDLLKLIAAASEIGYERISLTTNGRALASREFASVLLLSGLSDIQATLYGHNRPIHESVTRSPGSFDETIAGIQNIIRLKPDRVSFGVNTVVTKQNYMHIEKLMSMISGLGVKKMTVHFLVPMGRARAGHNPPMKKACAILSSAIEKFGAVMDISIVNLPWCLLPVHASAMADDTGKFSRHMAFVNAPPENLATYLSRARTAENNCMSCSRFICCGGFFQTGVL